MDTLQIIVAFSCLSIFVGKWLIYLQRKSDMAVNYNKINAYRTKAYQCLNNSLKYLSISSIQNDVLYHNLFATTDDYYKFKSLLSDVKKYKFWYSKNTLDCLNRYFNILEEKAKFYGLNANSEDYLFHGFGIENYSVFEKYQMELLESIKADHSQNQKIELFLQSKDTLKKLNVKSKYLELQF